MTYEQREKYSNMSIEQLEVEINDLNNERMDVAQAMQDGNIKQEYGKKKYAKVDKMHGELSILFEQRLAQQHKDFVSCFI